MQLTSLGLHATNFSALPPSWTALSSLRKLELDRPGSLGAEGALHPLDSWTQLTSLRIDVRRIDVLRIDGKNMPYTRGSLEQQLTRLSALQHLHIGSWVTFEVPPGRWQDQLTSLECDLQHALPAGGSPTSAAAVLAQATSLRRLRASGNGKPTQPQLRALLGALAALPALERVELACSLQREVEEAHTALGNPLGARLQFNRYL